jgi:hypothetical protein
MGRKVRHMIMRKSIPILFRTLSAELLPKALIDVPFMINHLKPSRVFIKRTVTY